MHNLRWAQVRLVELLQEKQELLQGSTRTLPIPAARPTLNEMDSSSKRHLVPAMPSLDQHSELRDMSAALDAQQQQQQQQTLAVSTWQGSGTTADARFSLGYSRACLLVK